MYKVVLGCVRIASYSRSERNGNCRVGAPVGHAFDPFYLLSSRLTFRLHLLSSSLPTRPPAQDKPPTNHFPSHSHGLQLSPFYLIFCRFSCHFRHRRAI